MLSRFSAPLYRIHVDLSKAYNLLPATYTTLHGTNRPERHTAQNVNITTAPKLNTAHRSCVLHGFNAVNGSTPLNSQCFVNQRLFHASRGDQNFKKYTRNIEVPDFMKKASAQALTEEAPKQYQPYLRLMRFDKPIGSWLLFFPGAFAISMAALPGHLPSLSLLALFGAGSILMRGAGCTVNDMMDVDFDKRVARTRNRPLASGQISQQRATVFLAGQLGVSLAILLSMNAPTIALGCMSILPVALYPLAKRYTYWPQAFLGMTFNWGVLMGYAAVTGHLGLTVTLPLYASGVAWTLFYDTIYAHQDKKDDLMIGVKSTALLFGDDTKTWLAKFGGVMVSGLTLSGLCAGQTLPYYLGVAAVAGHLYWQASTVNLNNPDDCGEKFRSNRNLGLILLGAIIAGSLMKTSPRKEVQK